MSFAIIQRSPGGLNGYSIWAGRTFIWTSGGQDGVIHALTDEVGAKGAAAVKFAETIKRALRPFDGRFGLVALPEKRRRKAASARPANEGRR